MKLEDLISDIDNLSTELIIFQKDELSVDGDVYLFPNNEEMNNSKLANEKYFYLLELDIAKEFLEDYYKSIKDTPNLKDAALRLFQYAINDA